MEIQKCEKFSKSSKLTKLNSVRTPSFRMSRNEIALASSISVLHKWYFNGKVFTSTTTWEPRNFFSKSSKFNLTCILTRAEELKSTFKYVSTCTYMSTSRMHRRLFEGRHLVLIVHGVIDDEFSLTATYALANCFTALTRIILFSFYLPFGWIPMKLCQILNRNFFK